MGTVHVYEPDGEHREWEARGLPERNVLMELVGGYLEYVKVLYKGKATYMVVNETGAVQDPPLPVNDEATTIYHAATLHRAERGEDISQFGPQASWPKIHGVAVVMENIHVP